MTSPRTLCQSHSTAALVLLLSLCGAAVKTIPAGESAGRLPDLANLPQKVRGQAAIDALGDKLGAVAAAYQHTAAEMRDLLRDEHDLWVDTTGRLLYECEAVATPAPAPAPVVAASSELQAAAIPTTSQPIFHSRPGASKIIFLEFRGGLVSGTAWGGPFDCYPWSTDADYSTFSDAEQLAIKRVWQRIAEDFAPFNVDVTTDPAASGTKGVILFTRNTDKNGKATPSSGKGGVAYIGVFGNSYYWPAWVSTDGTANAEQYMAAAGTHEMGHNLGLRHDGKTDGTEYYNGHGSGDTSWGPIMGSGYYSNVTTWSKGEYYLANRTEDDLGLIAGYLSYRSDDHGNTNATATALTIASATTIASTTPDTDPTNANPANKGVISSSTDVDVWKFATGTGNITLNVNPWISPASLRGGNLDVRLELYNSSGAVVAYNDPPERTNASLSVSVAAGTYYLHIKPVGTGTPLANPPSGYTVYGSLGQYFISGSVVDPSASPGTVQFSAATYSANENGGSVTITATRTGGSIGAVGVSYATGNVTAAAGSDYSAASGTLAWASGDSVSKTFSVALLDDSTYEGNETVNLTLSAPTGGAILGAQSSAVLTIVENEPAPPVITSALTASGTAGVPFSYTITASNAPTSFNATGLPSGLSVNTATGVISGTPTLAGTSNIGLSATNAGGTGNASLVLTIALTPNQPPVLQSAPWANPNPVTLPANSALSVLASDPDAGPNALVFTWSVVSGPAGGTASFTPNASSTASSCTASFNMAGIYNVQVQVSDGAGSVTGSLVVTANNPVASVHVAAISMSAAGNKKGRQARATVSIVDNAGRAISNATVTGTWSGLVSGTSSGLTGTAGSVTLSSARTRYTGTVTFAVSSVSAAGYLYAPEQNVVNSASISLGASATNAVESEETGGGEQLPGLMISSLRAIVSFASPGRDACSLSGIIVGLPEAFAAAGQTVTLKFGGEDVTFALDDKGCAKSARGALALKLSAAANGEVPFSATLRSGSWASAWQLDPNLSASNQTLNIGATLELAGATFSGAAIVSYSAKAGVGAKIKD